MNLPFRLSHLALLLSLASVSAVACGPTESDDDGSGGAGEDEGTGGHGGSDDGGSGGSDDDGSGGGGDDGSGGGGDDGSGGATGGGGSGGGTGGVPTGDCGDGELEGLEQCDDNNAVDDDACSAECTLTACDDCRTELCSDFGGYLSCEGLTVSGDPLAQDSCEDLLACYRAGCAAGGDPRACYCGTGGFASGTQEYEDFMGVCFAGFAPSEVYDGDCKDEVVEVAGTDVPIGIGTMWFDPATALGFANNTVQCEKDSCETECDYEAEGTGGSTGTGGSSGSGGSSSGGATGSGGAGTGGETGSGGAIGSGGGNGCSAAQEACEPCIECRDAECAAEMTAAFTGGSGLCTTVGLGACFAYQDCVETTGCAMMSGGTPQEELINCYCGGAPDCFDSIDPEYPQGACSSWVRTLTGNAPPTSVEGDFLSSATGIGAVNAVLLCQKDSCETECAPYFEAP